MTDEVGRVRPLFDGRKLRVAREFRGLSQRQLATEVGTVTPAAISQFESGDSLPRRRTLVRIAEVTNFPIAFFVTPASGDEATSAFFRSLRSTSSTARRIARAKAQLVSYLIRALERHVRLPPPALPVRTIREEASLDEIETLALDTRTEWGIEPGPIGDMVRTLERHGAVTARLKVDSVHIDAFSVPFPDRPVIILGSDKGVRVRSRLDAAHELGHLIMHESDQCGTKIAEAQANQFAAAFLMPAGQISGELPTRIDWSQIMRLKQTWGVSMAAILYRAHALEVLSDRAYVQSMKAMSARGWRRLEPGDNHAPESPRLLVRALRVVEENGTTLEDLAEEAGLPLEDVVDVVETTRDPRPRVEL